MPSSSALAPNARDVDAQTDIWALRVTFYELVTGHLPFAGRTVAEITGAALHLPSTPSARTDPASPWQDRRVWLALAGVNGRTYDTDDANEGLLTPEDVVTLDLAGTDWVVLSACHSAIAQVWSRESIVILRSAHRDFDADVPAGMQGNLQAGLD